MENHGISHDRKETTNEEVIRDYCKQFKDLMQAQIHQKYDLRSSKKRSRETEQQEETSPQTVPPLLNKGKGKLNPESSKVKSSLNKGCNSSEEHTKEKTLVLLKATYEKEREIEEDDEKMRDVSGKYKEIKAMGVWEVCV